MIIKAIWVNMYQNIGFKFNDDGDWSGEISDLQLIEFDSLYEYKFYSIAVALVS